ncbi:unnamed protein product [Peniophora sp. CBMAI 1063]|nr:unnamed protein product [Peniophora sp. CBMAI 1063]
MNLPAQTLPSFHASTAIATSSTARNLDVLEDAAPSDETFRSPWALSEIAELKARASERSSRSAPGTDGVTRSFIPKMDNEAPLELSQPVHRTTRSRHRSSCAPPPPSSS